MLCWLGQKWQVRQLNIEHLVMHKKMVSETHHHEQTKSNQVTNVQHVKGLIKMMEEMAIHF